MRVANVRFFMKLRTLGSIPLIILERHTLVSCDNAKAYNGRVTWIIKHHSYMMHDRWRFAPDNEEIELT